MMKHLLYISFILVFIDTSYSQQKGANVANIGFNYSNNVVNINYDIVNYTFNESYNLSLSIFKENGSKLNALSFSGDLIAVRGGTNKTISWNAKKDGYVLDEKIAVEISIAPKVEIPVASHLLKSALFPGLGDYKIRNKKHHFIYGIIGYGAVGASIYMNQQTIKSYDSYKKSFNNEEANNLFAKAQQQQTLSYLFAATACAVWTIDLSLLAIKTKKVKKQITEKNSKYYYQKSQQSNAFTSQPNFINTKTPYDLAMERGDKLLLEEKYEGAKIAYEEAYKHEATETISNKMLSINKLIAEAKNKTITYDSYITKGQELMALKQLKEAKVAFEEASNIKPKEKYPLNKIEEINQILNQLEIEKLYDAQMIQGMALLRNGDFEAANIFFKNALTYKQNDLTALSKCKECANGIAINEQKKINSKFNQIIAEANSAFNLKKYETAKEKYNEAKQLKPDNIEVQNKIELCDFYSRLAVAKNEADAGVKITQLEYLKYDYPSKSEQLDDLIREAKKHKQIKIPLAKVGNSHTIKAKINGSLSFDFIVDTGADNVLVSPDVFITFYKAGLITEADIIGKQHFSIADGSTVKGLKFYLRKIQIGEIILNNVEASVIAGGDYDMLLGGSVFKKIGKITIDYNNHELIIEK